MFRLDIARYDQHRVVRRVPGIVPVSRITELHILQIIHPANNRIAVRTGLKCRCHCHLMGIGLGIIFSTHTPFFLDHFNLLVKFNCRQCKVSHTIRFQFKILHAFVLAREDVLTAIDGSKFDGDFTGIAVQLIEVRAKQFDGDIAAYDEDWFEITLGGDMDFHVWTGPGFAGQIGDTRVRILEVSGGRLVVEPYVEDESQ